MFRRTFIAVALAAMLGPGVHAQGQGSPGAPAPAGAAPPAAPASPQGGPQQNNQISTGSAVSGKQLYLDYSCYACHGFNAQTGNGQRLLPPRLNQAQFVAYIRAPRTQGMPAYSLKVLTDVQVADIFAYILSLPRAPDIRDVPLLNQLPK